ncbi:hypothetical protein CF326_g8072 [Tilletia indica]|nr:hypothetical protein CF326_g8072 [Tilletia indica]
MFPPIAADTTTFRAHSLTPTSLSMTLSLCCAAEVLSSDPGTSPSTSLLSPSSARSAARCPTSFPSLIFAWGRAAAADTPAYSSSAGTTEDRPQWTRSQVSELYNSPLLELIFRSATVRRLQTPHNRPQLCTLMNIKESAIPKTAHTACNPLSTHYGFDREQVGGS